MTLSHKPEPMGMSHFGAEPVTHRLGLGQKTEPLFAAIVYCVKAVISNADSNVRPARLPAVFNKCDGNRNMLDARVLFEPGLPQHAPCGFSCPSEHRWLHSD